MSVWWSLWWQLMKAALWMHQTLCFLSCSCYGHMTCVQLHGSTENAALYSPCWNELWPVQCTGQYQSQKHFCPQSWYQNLPGWKNKNQFAFGCKHTLFIQTYQEMRWWTKLYIFYLSRHLRHLYDLSTNLKVYYVHLSSRGIMSNRNQDSGVNTLVYQTIQSPDCIIMYAIHHKNTTYITWNVMNI